MKYETVTRLWFYGESVFFCMIGAAIALANSDNILYLSNIAIDWILQ